MWQVFNKHKFSSWSSPYITKQRSTLQNYIYIGSSAGKISTCKAGNPVWFLGQEDSPGKWISYPLQYSCLENPHGQRSLAGYSSWACKESDMTGGLRTYEILLELCLLCLKVRVGSYLNKWRPKNYFKFSHLLLFPSTIKSGVCHSLTPKSTAIHTAAAV